MLLVLVVCACVELASSQALWTQIFVDSNNQVDLWTQSSEGCRCSFDSSKKNCACCVKNGGCPCGEDAPHRCSQCGINQHCTNMCNMTIDARTIIAKSGKSYGQLKPPSVQGPSFCWYSFIPDDNHRVEIQIYRLISVGKYNGTSCEGGYVQLVDGMSPVAKATDAQICGINERFSPPALIFGDNGPATLMFRVTEPTVRSQFMAYYSFTTTGQTLGPGFRPLGGKLLDGTVCDWMYHESNCKGTTCYLSSPSFPGMYPPNSKCHYRITLSQHSTVRINFKAINMPHNHCNADNVKVYKGPTSSSPLLLTTCANKKQVLSEQGPNILIEFSSGTSIHPFDYNGFAATLEFISPPTTTISTTTLAVKTTEPPMSGRMSSSSNGECTLILNGNETRTGHFDSRSQAWKENCTVMFIGRENDVIHISFTNYHLRTSSCQTVIEVYHQLPLGNSIKPYRRICSPVKKHNRDAGRNQLQDSFLSTANIMLLFLRKLSPSEISENEFVEGTFIFHDEHLEGTLQPDSLCDVKFFGGSSSKIGQIRNPGGQHSLWNSQTPMLCTQTFVPTANQSIILKVVSLKRLHLDSGNCQTACGDGGCNCLPRDGLAGVNHVKLLSSSGKILSCLCGDFQVEWLPVGIRSWTPISLVYSVAPNSWAAKGFHFQADYFFQTDTSCGNHVLVQHSGVINSRSFTEGNLLNYYYYQTCSWRLDSNVERQLTVEVESTQNRPCTAWNITLFEYNEMLPEKTGQLLHTFCPRDVLKSYELPWKQNIIVIKLNAMTRLPPEFSFKWKSQIVRTNTRLAGITPVQPSRADRVSVVAIVYFLLVVHSLI
uniref:Cubilin n=3 Tax=Lygus hesperus TaxID=30085 RepID=A0A146LBY2_LYGHE